MKNNDMKTSENILKISAEIELILKQNQFAEPNQNAVSQLRFLALELQSLNIYAAEKAYEIIDKALIFYSVKKHQSHTGGASALWSEINNFLLRIKTQANTWQSQGK